MMAVGMMSGTSLDGVDVALLRTDGAGVVSAGPALTVPYQAALREKLRKALGRREAPAETVEALTRAHAEALEAFYARFDLKRFNIDLIGFHGQTIWHRPEQGLTVQIGDGALLAELTNVPVVCDFRAADVAAGGQGAPLVPVYHAALAVDLPKPLAVVNIGGVANVTWIGEDDELLAFDTGPGNALMDDWVRLHTGRNYDKDGALAAEGDVDLGSLSKLLANSYFERPPPKSLDRNDFRLEPLASLSAEDGAATLAAVTIAAIGLAEDHFPESPKRWIVAGGGRHNRLILAGLREQLDQPVLTAEDVGWDGDALEAQAFAYLAVRSIRGLPLTFPGTTGVRKPLTGGRLFRPAKVRAKRN
jgi:anhydro-N-acetylmuramic acid kinase